MRKTLNYLVDGLNERNTFFLIDDTIGCKNISDLLNKKNKNSPRQNASLG